MHNMYSYGTKISLIYLTNNYTHDVHICIYSPKFAYYVLCSVYSIQVTNHGNQSIQILLVEKLRLKLSVV